MKNTLNYIRRIEETRGKYLYKYFSARQVDGVFSEISKVRKQTADGKTFECKYYFDVDGHYMDFKVVVKNCGATFKPTGAICPITNQPMSAKVKQYYVANIDFADGISRYIEELKQKYVDIEKRIQEQTTPTYEEYLGHCLIIDKMYDSNWDCLSIKELEKFLGKELADGKSININKSTIMQLFNSNQISLRLARYLHNYVVNKSWRNSQEITFKYVDVTAKYNDRVKSDKDSIETLQNRLVSIETDIQEWEKIKGLYS